MQSRLRAAAAKHELEEPSAEVAGLISHAVHERLKNLIEKLAVVAQHRIDLIKVIIVAVGNYSLKYTRLHKYATLVTYAILPRRNVANILQRVYLQTEKLIY